MSQITDVALFYSKFSKPCVSCVEYVQTRNLPVELISLDTVESRDVASKGKVQIRNVPSLVIKYDNGEVQLYIGVQKILGWLEAALQKSHPPPIDNYVQPPEKKKKNPKRKHYKVDPPPNSVELVLIDDDHYDHNDQIAPTSSHISTNSKLSMQTAKPSLNANLMAQAKQMEAERNQLLNYDPNDQKKG